MTKLDWSRGYTPDPARVRDVVDFSSPDPVVVVSTKALKKRRPKTWEQLEERKGRRQAHKQATKTKRAAPKQAKPKKAKDRLSEEDRLRAEAERKAKSAEHNERYLKNAARKERAMAAKKKSHLEAWAEMQGITGSNRLALRDRWRSTLLRER